MCCVVAVGGVGLVSLCFVSVVLFYWSLPCGFKYCIARHVNMHIYTNTLTRHLLVGGRGELGRREFMIAIFSIHNLKSPSFDMTSFELFQQNVRLFLC